MDRATRLGEARALLGARYPSFVYVPRRRALSPGPVPVFMFHTIEARTFEAQLRFLAENGYRTATLDAFHDALLGRRSLPDASVLLTFDDVERGLLTRGVPLLKRYGLRCAAFLAPGRLGGAAAAAAGKAWATWDDARALLDSGVVDIGAHSLNHAAIFVSDRLCGFVRPGCFRDGLGLDNPWVRRGDGDGLLSEPGAPLFDTASRLGPHMRFLDSEDVRERCISHVRERGGASYFRHAGWSRELSSCWRAAVRDCGGAGVWETADEQAEAMRLEITEAGRLLERHLHVPVRDFALPWAEGSPLALTLCRQAGYRSVFWGSCPPRPRRRDLPDPFALQRLKDDYLLRLPGRGRHGLLRILAMKGQRRLSHRDIY